MEVIIIKNFNVSIIETVGFTVDIKADNKVMAEKIAKEMYEKDNTLGDNQKELIEVEYIAD